MTMNKNFRPMLAGTIKDIKELQQLNYPIIASPKLDGIRCLIHPGFGAVSRTMKAIPNQFLWQMLSCSPYLNIEKHQNLYHLDGELICGNPTAPNVYQHTVSEVMTHHNTSRLTQATFVVFDTFHPDYIDQFYDKRLEFIKAQVRDSNFNNKTLIQYTRQNHSLNRMPTIEVIESKICHTPDDILRAEEEYLQLGYEGIMLRSIFNSKYKCGRSTLREQYLLKLKRFSDAEATIVGYEPLQRNHNTAEKDAFGLTKRSTHMENKVDAPLLGNLIVQSLHPDYLDIEFSIGTGFTESQRIDLWNRRESLIGQVIKYKYQEVGVKDKPRFPVFLGFRPAGA